MDPAGTQYFFSPLMNYNKKDVEDGMKDQFKKVCHLQKKFSKYSTNIYYSCLLFKYSTNNIVLNLSFKFNENCSEGED